jgi:uncharacterized protein YdhG (YjbR/CyaY superfamily)
MATELTFEDYLATIADESHRAQLGAVLAAIEEEFPQLERRVAWKQPMFTDHGTFIIGFSAAKGHFSVATEAALAHFSDRIKEAGLTATSRLFRIPWGAETENGPILELIFDMIRFTIVEKKDVQTFWAK